MDMNPPDSRTSINATLSGDTDAHIGEENTKSQTRLSEHKTLNGNMPIKQLVCSDISPEKEDTASISETSVGTTETNSSTGSIQDCRDADGRPFRRMPPKRSSLSTIKLALAVVENEKGEVDENIQKQVTMLDKGTPRKPFRRISSGRKLQVKWPPVTTKKINPLPSYIEETIFSDEASQRIKEKIELYETIHHERMQKKVQKVIIPGDFDHNSYPTMKLRATYLDDTGRSVDSLCSEEVLANISLSPGHSLPIPTGCRKHRRISYRIRFGVPDLQGEKEADSAHEERRKNGTDATPVRRKSMGSTGGGICGFNRPKEALSGRRPLRRKSLGDHSAKVENDGNGHHGFERPDVWITPLKSKDGSRKWIAKRVWDVEDKDDEEPEYEVDHTCLMEGVRGLLGIPEEWGTTTDEWQVNIDESDPWETAADKDSAPNFPSRPKGGNQDSLSVEKVVDIDGQQYGAGTTAFLYNEAEFDSQFEHITDVTKHENYLRKRFDMSTSSPNRVGDIDSSGVSIADCLDGDEDEDDTSVSVSLSSHCTDAQDRVPLEDDQEAKQLQKNERWLSTSKQQDAGFNAKSWMNQLAASTAILVLDTKDDKKDDKKKKKKKKSNGDATHSERGYGRPDWWVLPKDDNKETPKNAQQPSRSRSPTRPSIVSEEYETLIKDLMRARMDMDTGISKTQDEFEALANNIVRTRVDARAENPRKTNHSVPIQCEEYKTLVDDILRVRMGMKSENPSKNRNSTPLQSEQYTTLVDDLLQESMSVDSDSEDSDEGDDKRKKGKKKKKKKKKIRRRITRDRTPPRAKSLPANRGRRIKYDSDEEKRKRGTPTWQKKTFQMDQKPSDLKLWWQC